MNKIWIFLRRFSAPYKWNIFWCLVFNILTAFLTIFSFAFIIPILEMLFGMSETHYAYIEPSAGNFRDALVNNFYYYTDSIIRSYGASAALAMLAGLLILMTLLKTWTAYMGAYTIMPMRQGVLRDMRDTMYDKILSLPMSFFSSERKGDIMARISGDVQEVEVSITASIFSMVKFPVMIIVCLATMIMISWQLTVFVFVMLPLFGWIMGSAGRKLKARSLKSQQMWSELLSITEETIGGLRIIKAFVAERHMSRRFHQHDSDFTNLNISVSRRIELAHPLSEFLGTVAIAAVLWFGGSLILSGSSSIDAAGFIYYMVVFYSLINPAKELAKTFYSVRKGSASLERIDKILDATNPIQSPARPISVAPRGEMSEIEFRNVTFRYDPDPGRPPVIDNVSLKVRPGQTVAIVGQSGSGKSTLVDLVPRLWDVSAGAVLVNGVDVRDASVNDLRSLMGNVNQEAILFNDSIFNNIAFGCEGATRAEVEEAARMANAHDFIMATPQGYDTMIGDRGCRLSGGQRQRLSIARALLKNPSILILDEATSALDTQSERLVQEALERLMHNRTTIVIAHRLSTIAGADLICVMQDGRIIEQGTHSALMERNGAYRRLVDLQNV